MINSDVEISLCIVSYCHEKYIRKAIESALMQKVNVPFEIIVSDDCSNDKTLEIVREYGDKIRIVEHKENVGLSRNFYDAFRAAEGKYVSLMAGDDWLITDDYLQRHYDFLINNPICSAVSHNTIAFDKDDKEFTRCSASTKPFSVSDYINGEETSLDYGLVRNIFKRQNLEWLYTASPKTDETTFVYYILKNGNWGLIEDYCYAHRHIVDGTNYNSKNTSVSNYLNVKNGLEYISNNIENVDFSKRINKYGALAMRQALYLILKKRDCSVWCELKKSTTLLERVKYFTRMIKLQMRGE